MSQVWFLALGVFLVRWELPMTNAAETYVTCLSCPDVASPSDCRNTRICGKGERCSLFLNAKTLFGKRDVAPAPPGKCYDCCTGDECNGHLCQGGGGNQVFTGFYTTAQLTTTACPTFTCPKTTCPTCPTVTCPTCWCPQTTTPAPTHNPPACPGNYIQHKDKCYQFNHDIRSWSSAESHCSGRGADLASINSLDELYFLAEQICQAWQTTDIYIGGTYSHSKHTWQWTDGSPLGFTHWGYLLPGSMTDDKPYIALSPSCKYDLKNAYWKPVNGRSYQPYICEKQAV